MNLNEVAHPITVSHSQLSDWYGFTLTDVVKRGGAFMKVYYRSLEEAMKTLYPTYPWYSNFSGKDLAAHSLAYFWRNTDNQREFLDSVAKELGIKKVKMLVENFLLYYIISGFFD